MSTLSNETYHILFKNYPDVLSVKQTSEMLDVSTKTVYKMIHNGELSCRKVGRDFRIPKIFVMEYLKIFCEIDN